MSRFVIGWFLIVFSCHHLSAQDSLLLQKTERYAAGYLKTVVSYATIFSGNREQPLGFSTSNHPYFKEQDFTTGRLSYDGIIYPGVHLRWDLYKDQLIVLSPNNYNIVLQSVNVNFFEIYGYHVFQLLPDGLAGCPSAGYYILLYSADNYFLLEKLTNSLQEENIKKYRYNFNLSSKFYLQKEDAYYKIQNRRTLLNCLETHRNELKHFMRSHHLRYKKDAEKTVLETIREHEKLSRR